jgi:hypothetical protein
MRAQGDHANNNSTTVETEMDEMLVLMCVIKLNDYKMTIPLIEL